LHGNTKATATKNLPTVFLRLPWRWGLPFLSYLRVDVIIRFQDFVVRVHRFDGEHAVLVNVVDAAFHVGKFFYCKVEVIKYSKGFDGFEPDVYIAVPDLVGNDLVALAFGKLYFPAMAILRSMFCRVSNCSKMRLSIIILSF